MLKKIITCSLILFLVLSTITPSFATTESTQNESEEEYQLYRLLEEVSIDDLFVLPKDTLIFAQEEEGHLLIETNGNTFRIDANEVTKLNDSKELGIDKEFINQLLDTEPLEKNVESKSTLHFNETEFTLKEQVDFEVFSLEDSEYVFIAGIPYKISQPNEKVSNSEGELVEEESKVSEEDQKQQQENNTSNELEDPSSDDHTQNKNQETNSVEDDSNQDSIEDGQITKEDKSSSTTSEKKEADSSTFSAKSVDIWTQSTTNYFKVNVYSLPVYINKNGNLIKQAELREGQVYKRTGSLSNWHIIDFGGQSGYVWKDSTSPFSGNLPKNFTNSNYYGDRTITTTNNAVIYDNTSGSLVPYGMLVKNINFPVISEAGNWYKVNYANRVGYIHKNGVKPNFVSSDNYFEVTVHSLPIYESKNGSLVKVGELRKNEVYKRIGTAGNWHAIQFGNKQGYVWSDDTIPANENEMASIANPNNTSGTFTTKDHTVVYDNTSGEMIPIGQISKGNSYPYELIAGNWIKVSFGNRYGYVYKEWVNFNFTSSQNYFRVNEDYLPVYHNVGGSLEKVGHLVENQVYKRTGSKGDWHEIKFGNKVGYVWSKSTQPSSSNAASNWNTNLSDSNTQLIARNGLKIYDNTSGMVLFARVEEGTTIPIIDKVGNWYRVLIGNRIGYFYETGVSDHVYNYTNYNISLNDMVNRQLTYNPQTDDHTYAYVHKDYIRRSGSGYPFTGTVNATSLHVRDIPNGNSYGTIQSGAKVTVVGISSMNSSWYKIKNPYNNYGGWMKADKDQLNYYMNPKNFVNNPVQRLQFLRLDLFSNTSTSQLAKLLVNKGILTGKQSVFYNAAKDAGINEVYLIAHSLLETGNGTSELATGIPVMIERNSSGKPIVEDGVTKVRLATTAEKPDSVVYNVYGIGAYDGCAKRCGAEYAFNAGWTNVDKAIYGGAKFISTDFIKSSVYKQNTLYKMKWNPGFFVGESNSPHQYATDIGWAYKQVNRISKTFDLLDNYNMHLDIPSFK